VASPGALGQQDRALREAADAQLGALQVQQHGDGPAAFALDLPDQVVADLVVGVAAVAEVEPEHVGAGFEQGGDRGPVRTRGTERGDDFSVALASHGAGHPGQWVADAATLGTAGPVDQWHCVNTAMPRRNDALRMADSSARVALRGRGPAAYLNIPGSHSENAGT
jgi:hypothetical protein